MIWFNHSFSKNVSTKIGKYFLYLHDKHFPQNHRLHKISNRSNVKVSYICTKSMETIINNYNKNILGTKPLMNTATCSCWNKETCPLSGQCQIRVVYEVTLSSNQLNCKEKSILELQKNLSSSIKTTRNFLRNSDQSRWRIHGFTISFLFRKLLSFYQETQ